MKRSGYEVLIKRFGIAICAWILSTAAICALTGLLVTNEIIKIEFACSIVRALSLGLAFVLCWFLPETVGKQKLLVSLIAAVAVILLAFLGKAILCPESGILWKRVMLVCVAGVTAGVVSSGKKTGNRRY